MKYRFATAAVIAVMIPGTAFAATSDQLVPLYQQLIALLTQELQLLQAQRVAAAAAPRIVVDSPSGTAPYTALISLPSLDGTEALDFGDGHSTGSNGCVLNAKGYCDIKPELVHTYQYPGTYTLTLYRHFAGQKDASVVATSSIVVSR